MKKYRITKEARYHTIYNVHRQYFGFLWIQVFWDTLVECRRYVEDNRKPFIEEYL